MRAITCGLALLFVSCTQAPPLERPSPHPRAIPDVPAPIEKKALIQHPGAATPEAPVSSARLTQTRSSDITFEGVAFDSRTHRLAVIDQPDGPASQFPDAETAAQSRHAIAAINAGFFTPEGKPLGLVVADGIVSGTWNSASSLGSGVWLQQASGNLNIVRREKLGREAAKSQREVIQAGPMLIENSHSISGLESAKTTVRTLVLWDGGTRWWIGQASPCTLAQLSDVLSHTEPAGWKIRHALNFDGGRSSDLWISSEVSGGPLTRRALWNRPVRNFLVLLPR